MDVITLCEGTGVGKLSIGKITLLAISSHTQVSVPFDLSVAKNNHIAVARQGEADAVCDRGIDPPESRRNRSNYCNLPLIKG